MLCIFHHNRKEGRREEGGREGGRNGGKQDVKDGKGAGGHTSVLTDFRSTLASMPMCRETCTDPLAVHSAAFDRNCHMNTDRSLGPTRTAFPDSKSLSEWLPCGGTLLCGPTKSQLTRS